MKILSLFLCALGVFAAPAIADTPSSQPSQAVVLSTPYPATIGDMIAFTMTQNMSVVQALDSNVPSPIVCAFDHGTQKITVTIYGDPRTWGRSPGRVDQAKFSLEYFRTKVFPLLAPIVTKTYNVALTDSDLTLIYLDRTAKMREVLRREADTYLVAE